jgi:hypothetical protein
MHLATVDLVFYGNSQFPLEWKGSKQKKECGEIDELVRSLFKGPLFASGRFLSERFYQPNSLLTTSFLKKVMGERVLFFDQRKKKEVVEEQESLVDQVVVRGAVYLQRNWIVLYSTPGDDRLYGVAFDIFKRSVCIHSLKEGETLPEYQVNLSGDRLQEAMDIALEVAPRALAKTFES